VDGRVFLVGAGPGDLKLLTLRGLECLEQADVVVYDRLASAELIERAKPSAERVYVGKGPGRHTMTQDEINRLLVERASSGRVVVRLKGGDPYVFGRGGEEGLALAAAGVPFEVVPGVTSAIAGPSFAGIPITHRGIATSFTVATGHEDPTKAESGIRWRELALGADTLVFLMGVEYLDHIVARLREAGRPTDEPAAAIRWATTPEQEVVTGTLGDIAQRVRSAGLRPPAVLVVGRVVALRPQLDWRARLPLAGLRVLVTRARQQASQLSARLVDLGASPIEYPTIEIRPADDPRALDEALARLARFGWVIFTSTNGVESFFARLAANGRDARALGACRVAAIGPSTAAALRAHGIRADWIPDRFLTDGILEGFRQFELRDVDVLLARADIAPPALADGLRAQGTRVTEVTAYRTVPADASRDRLLDALERRAVDVVTLTSSSTVRNLVDGLGGRLDLLEGVTIACIGPITAATAAKLGLTVDVQAEEHTIDGLVAALVEWKRKAVSRQASGAGSGAGRDRGESGDRDESALRVER
jgi:uroporphyrinogen III methyltransferase/synthase